MKKILVLLAHSSFAESKVNKAIIERISKLENVKVHDLYKEYPDFKINVKKEQELLINSDLIIFQFPFNWYSCPAILKEWQDKVLLYGFAYGSGGNALHGKDFLVSISTGGDQNSYQKGGSNNFTINELLKPIEQTAKLCGMNYLPYFTIHGVPNFPKVPLTDLQTKALNIHIEKLEAFLINS